MKPNIIKKDGEFTLIETPTEWINGKDSQDRLLISIKIFEWVIEMYKEGWELKVAADCMRAWVFKKRIYERKTDQD